MIDQLTNPTVITVGTVTLALVSAAAYNYFTGNRASVDVDNDGESEVTFGGNDKPITSPEEAVKKNSSAEEVFNATEEAEGENLLDVKGIGPSLAQTLEQNDINNTDDLRDATDDELLDVSGIGPSKLETIRNDL